MTKEAYEKAVNSGLIYTQIAQTLARDYIDMFYINTDTEEYVEYRNGEEKCIVADAHEHTDGDLFFYKEHERVAWFNPHDIVGYRKVIEYGWSDIDTAVKEQDHE